MRVTLYCQDLVVGSVEIHDSVIEETFRSGEALIVDPILEGPGNCTGLTLLGLPENQP